MCNRFFLFTRESNKLSEALSAADNAWQKTKEKFPVLFALAQVFIFATATKSTLKPAGARQVFRALFAR
jgi:hypothetical protein